MLDDKPSTPCSSAFMNSSVTTRKKVPALAFDKPIACAQFTTIGTKSISFSCAADSTVCNRHSLCRRIRAQHLDHALDAELLLAAGLDKTVGKNRQLQRRVVLQELGLALEHVLADDAERQMARLEASYLAPVRIERQQRRNA